MKTLLRLYLVMLIAVPSMAIAGEREPLHFNNPDILQTVGTMHKSNVGIKTAVGENLHFNVELAVTEEQQAKGLMYRTQMPDHTGMLFLFDTEDQRSFWMKNTLIPLDMLFIDHSGMIKHIHHSAKPQDLSVVTSEHPSVAVLELKGGTSYLLNIKEGDVVIHDAFMNTEPQ